MKKFIIILAVLITLCSCRAEISYDAFVSSNILCENNGGLRGIIVNSTFDKDYEIRSCVCNDGAMFSNDIIFNKMEE